MKLMALDGNSLAYRAFFALPEDMTNASGQVTNAVYGFTTMLLTLIREHSPDGVAVVFDRPEPTFRHEAIPEYKAQRESAPETLRQQLGMIRELLDVLGIKWFELAGFEGDDLIATMATHAEAQGHDLVIVTGDRDSYQLVHDPHIKVLYNKRGVSDYAIYDEAGILERTGVTPAQYPDYAALRGDPSDNLNGVPGVGEKTAAKLINQYGNLDGVLLAAESQTPKLQASLLEHGDRVKRNAAMMVLRRDVPIDVDLSQLAPDPDLNASARLFEFLEFKTMQKRLTDLVAKNSWHTRGESPSIDHTSEVASVQVAFGEMVIAETAEMALTHLAGLEEFVLAASFEGEPGRSRIDSVAVVTNILKGATVGLPRQVLLDAEVSALLVRTPITSHDAKPIMRSLLADGVDLRGLVMDTAIATYLVNPSRSSYSLASVSLDLLGVEPQGSSESSGMFDFGVDGANSSARIAQEAVIVGHLSPMLRGQLSEIHNESLYADIENPLVRVLARMEHLGIAVNREALQLIRQRLTEETQALTTSLHEIVGRPFNLNSPTQLREILYEERQLTPGKKTKTGYSTDAATLEKLELEWPEFITPLLRYREVEKLRSTYGEGLLAEVADDGRIHATFNQTVARTGRLSSDQPNLHNIPVRTDEGRIFRTAFVASEGNSLLVADYNQIELRCIAHLANDPGLVAAFTAGEDIHTSTAARVFGVEASKVTHEQRSKAKMVSYGLAYGMEAYGLSQRLAIPVGEAQQILDAYFEAFPSVRKYMDDAVHEARQKQYTETLFGRRRPIPELVSDNFRIRQAGERQAMNAAIQGLAADVFKIALVRIDKALEDGGFTARLVLQVHDEVLVDVPHSEQDVVGPLVLDIMKAAADLRVPLEVNAAWGSTWADAKG
jgi:DNA polymerase-1